MTRPKDLGPPIYASLVLAFASFGDAYLYAFLPLNADALGLSAASIGILLSINRFIRLFANQWLVGVFARYGFRTVTIAAAALAAASTLGYGVGLGFSGWLAMRIAWGLAFAGMRISSLSYALTHEEKGLSLGISRSVYELGPVAGLLLGPWLLTWVGSPWTFTILGIASLPALFFAFGLPALTPETLAAKKKVNTHATFNVLTFAITFAAEGVVVIVLGAALLESSWGLSPAAAVATTAAFLAFRRFCLIFLSPLGGWLADRLGMTGVLTASAVLICVGLILAAAGLPSAGFAIVFLFGSVQAALGPGAVASGRTQAVAVNATWRDAGAAFGTLTGGLLLTSGYLSVAFFVLAAGIFVSLLAYLKSHDDPIKRLIIWK